MKKFLFAIATAILLISCEGNTDVKFQLQNNSSTNLTVYYSGTGEPYGLDTAQVPVGSTFVLYETSLLGGNGSLIPSNEFVDTLVVVNANSDTMQKDFTNMSNWMDLIDQTKKFPAIWNQEYTLPVTDADF